VPTLLVASLKFPAEIAQVVNLVPYLACEACRQFLLERLTRTHKLFSFLRLRRGELFDDAFQGELESMYRDTGAGKEAVPPALLAMVVLLRVEEDDWATADGAC
jgi:hypothetical protein